MQYCMHCKRLLEKTQTECPACGASIRKVEQDDLEAAEKCAAALNEEPHVEQEEFADMPPGKRTAVKIISMVLFLLLVTVVVLFTDYFIDIIKNFINRLI